MQEEGTLQSVSVSLPGHGSSGEDRDATRATGLVLACWVAGLGPHSETLWPHLHCFPKAAAEVTRVSKGVFLVLVTD